uniref:WD repeat-containing protein 60 n=1 Tax=Glossina brevipalpis TaxID=37001 RepID=A0A1A9W0T9_9MUSC
MLGTSGEDKSKLNLNNTLPKTQPVKTKTVKTKLHTSTDNTECLQTQLNTGKVSTSKNLKKSTKYSNVTNVRLAKPATISSAKKRLMTNPTPSVKPNAVLDTYHNVTVASPPMRKKAMPTTLPTAVDQNDSKDSLSKKLNRKNSHTLSPGEIVVLKKDSAKKRLEEQINRESNLGEKLTMPVKKEAIAFEVNFDKEQKVTRERSRSRSKTNERNKKLDDETEDSNNYSDDFDSYESDFETPTSSETESEEADISSTSQYHNNTNSNEPSRKDIGEIKTSSTEVSEEESEITQNPITVIHKYKERKLDSGNYHINYNAKPTIPHPVNISIQSNPHLYDSLDTVSLATSDQLDSGVSANSLNQSNSAKYDSQRIREISYGGYTQFHSNPIFSERGKELTSKIQFDAMNFVLLDMKPVSYEVYMQSFGKLHTTQISTQTQDNRLEAEMQTDDSSFTSVWTQHPPLHNSYIMQKMRGQQCCGEFSDARPEKPCKFENSLKALKDLSQTTNMSKYHENVTKQTKPLDLENLNSFLRKSSLIISQIMKTKRKSLQRTSSLLISEGFYCLESNFMNKLTVNHVYSNLRYNLVITVHESLPHIDVYHSDFSNLLMVWSVNEPKAPLRVLSTWSKVSHVEISQATQDIIVTALHDGSIAMWDLRETYSYCSKLDGYLTHFAATQSITPACYEKAINSKKISLDVGTCLTIKSFRCPSFSPSVKHISNNFQNSQFVSLHDSGILTMWTLVEISSNLECLNNLKSTKKFNHIKKSADTNEHTSPWARVKLIQSAIVQLKDYLECKKFSLAVSPFQQAQNLFQQNIYSDKTLREIGAQKGSRRILQNLIFQSLDVGAETIYICTNHNYILCSPKSLKTESFRCITLNETDFLFPTALKVLTNENFVAVGLSNGAVIILNCSHNKNLLSYYNDKRSETGKLGKPVKKLLSDDSFDDATATGKTCAIQNIILNERSALDRHFSHSSEVDDAQRPSTATCVPLMSTKPYELVVQDQLMISTGSVLRKSLVKSLELSFDGRHLFVLSDNNLRVYDFYLDQEIIVAENNGNTDTYQIKDITMTKPDSERQQLIVLKKNGTTEIHQLKNC